MIQILSYIGCPFSAAYVRSLLREEGDGEGPIHVRVESLGGSLLDALQMREDFRLSVRPVHVHFTGFSASAATILATGAAHISMSPSALILVHQCMGPVTEVGLMNKEEISEAIEGLRKHQDDLQTMDRLVASIYALRAGEGHTAEEMHRAMQDARWLSAEEALSLGLIDEIADIPEPLRSSAQAAEGGGKGDGPEASIRSQVVALGLPLPECLEAKGGAAPQAAAGQDVKPAAPGVISSIIASLKRAIRPGAHVADGVGTSSTENVETSTPAAQTSTTITPTENNIQLNPTKMKPTPQILALLAVTELAPTAEGTVSLSVAQIEALEDAICHLQTELQDARQSLAKADGDTTAEVCPSAQEEAEVLPGTEAMSFFNAFNEII